jgi:hypothetical protein
MLEGFMPRKEIKVVHAGTVAERYETLMNGEVDAATLMEPLPQTTYNFACARLIAIKFLPPTKRVLHETPYPVQVLNRMTIDGDYMRH